MGEPLRVDLKGECGTLASSLSLSSAKSLDLGLLLVGMDELCGSQRVCKDALEFDPWQQVGDSGAAQGTLEANKGEGTVGPHSRRAPG